MLAYRVFLSNSIAKIAKKGAPICGAEIGVGSARTSKYLLATIPSLHLLLVDRWQVADECEPQSKTSDEFAKSTASDHEERYVEAVRVLQRFQSRFTILRAASVDAAAIVVSSLDFVFIDADHSYEGCLADMRAWWPKVRQGGLFCGHDHHLPEHPDGTDKCGRGVAKAAAEFFNDVQRTYEVGDGRTWWMIK